MPAVMKKKVEETFHRLFGAGPGVRCFFAPGRANLIGEHIDYNGGHILACALELGTYAAVRKRNDQGLRMYSVNFSEEGVVCRDLKEWQPEQETGWTAYPAAVLGVLAENGMKLETGFDLVVGGDLPAGAGLSSSASLEVLTASALRSLYDLPLSGIQIARFAQRAERKYVGVDCGIMDQFTSAMGREGCAIDLDTVSLEHEYVPLSMDGVRLIITNTNRKHDLKDSAYNERRRQCDEALRILQAAGGDLPAVRHLCDLTPAAFRERCDSIEDPVLLRRATHAVYENDRVRQAVAALRSGDLETLGALMKSSHRSLRDDYEVSCLELDVLAETAWGIPGVLGSRMMGGGFGGCTISLVREEAVPSYQEIVGRTYRQKTGIDCTFYSIQPGGGPVEL